MNLKIQGKDSMIIQYTLSIVFLYAMTSIINEPENHESI